MLQTFYKRPLAVQAVQYAPNKSNETDIIQLLVSRGYAVRQERGHTAGQESGQVLVAEQGNEMLIITPSDYLIIKDNHLVVRDEEFFQRHYTSYRPY
jgi:hypothetical protein